MLNVTRETCHQSSVPPIETWALSHLPKVLQDILVFMLKGYSYFLTFVKKKKFIKNHIQILWKILLCATLGADSFSDSLWLYFSCLHLTFTPLSSTHSWFTAFEKGVRILLLYVIGKMHLLCILTFVKEFLLSSLDKS